MVPTRGNVRRVLMTADAVGGVWSYSMDLASALHGRGIEVTVAVMGPQLGAAQRADAQSRGVRIAEAAFRLEWMDDPWADVERAGPWLLSLARDCEADVAHLNGFCHAALSWEVPTVVVAHSCVRTWWRGVHGDDAPGRWDEYSHRVAAGLAAASLVVAPTRSLLNEVLSEYACTTRATVIPNGSSFVERGGAEAAGGGAEAAGGGAEAAGGGAEAPPYEWGEKDEMVLATGRLWDEAKNLASVCAIASQISWPVYVAGDLAGPSQCFVPSGAARYLGRVSPENMREWYGRAAIYAHPARYEPFGLSVLEAAAAGCALVLGDIRTLRENWNGAALFVPPDNRRALATAIEELTRDEWLRGELGGRARQRAAAFTVDRMADAYVAAYDGLLAPVAV